MILLKVSDITFTLLVIQRLFKFVLYTETTVQKFDITKHLISKSTLNRQKKISKEKLRKLRQGAEKYQLERKEQIVRELTSFHFNVF